MGFKFEQKMALQLYHLALPLGFLILWMTVVEGSPSINFEVSGLSNESVILPCQLSEETCGPIHSIKWHRGNRRVYIFSEIGATSKAEDDLVGRAELRLETNKSLAELEINPLSTADEDLYKCEVTYLEAKEHCALLQYIKLNTFAKPKYVKIENLSGTETYNDTVIGPFNEGTVITLVCISKGGKPVTKLNWFNNGKPLQGQYSNVTEDDGTGIATSQLRVELSRGDLGAKLECKASSLTLQAPMVAWVKVDVYVRPSSWEVSGYESPVLENKMVTLLCRVKGARPAANITWFNGTKPLSHQPHSNLAVQSDGTYETQSRLSFTATRYDNGIIMDCQTSNLVLESMGELPYRSLTKIQVNYKPVVHVSPPSQTLNETTFISINCEVDANPAELTSVRWYKNGQLLELGDISRYEGGTTLDPTLHIKNSTREDLGNYICVVENSIGENTSEGKAQVNILYKMSVRVSMDPPIPVREQDEMNVTLSCDVQSGNPEIVDAVRWYLDGDLLKQLPDCANSSSEVEGRFLSSELCDIDPTKLMLENVARSFQGNYQCKAKNGAGWGELSPPATLHVHYPPGPARIQIDPLIAVKGQMLNLRCVVDEPGRPPAKEYRWKRGSHVQMDQSTSNWTILPVSLEHRANFSCEAINEAGEGPAATVPIDVFVPPTFITPLMPYHGVPWNATEVKITCQVECFPICEIHWLKNGVPINFQKNFFTMKNTKVRPDPAKNDFESIISTLAWNMTAWPNGKLNRAVDNDNYTCQSSPNEYGTGVYSTTHFRVEYPPEKINVSSRVINVKEDEYPDIVTCSSNALPEATYTWKYGQEVVSEKNVLFFNYTLKRNHGGDYECIAQNPHGQISTRATINVLYAPECKITFEDSDEERVLVCTANANPGLVDFNWSLGNGTFPFPENVIGKKGLKSQLRLSPLPEYYGTYRCFANNSVGSDSCHFTVSGSWIRKISDNTLVIFSGIAVAVILIFFIICIIIILVCRKRRMSDKHPNTRPEERQNPEGKDLSGSLREGSVGSGTSSRNQTPRPGDNNNTSEANKWPIKPGVHLHVNGLHSLGKSVSGPINGFSYGTKNSCSSFPLDMTHSICEVLAGTNRKRKKPTRETSPTTRNGDLSDDGKAFYENLPFHGLQSPQSNLLLTEPLPQPLPTTTPNETEVRPPSDLSETGSSGYGSTRIRNLKCDGVVRGNPISSFEGIDENPQSTDSINSTPSAPKPTEVDILPPCPDNGSKDEEPTVIGPKTSTPIQSLPINPIPLPNSNNKQTKLATVKPQRISSNNNFGSLRPFRRSSPEGPKVFFSSIRGKHPPPPSLSHFLTRNSIRMEKESTRQNPQIVTALTQLQTIADTTKPSQSQVPPSEKKDGKLIPKMTKIPTQIKSNSKIVKKNSSSVNSTGTKGIVTLPKSNDTNNNNNSNYAARVDESWKPVPHPAPRSIQTLKHSRRHTYQNIPFTRKTPRSEPYRPTTMELDYADKDYRQFYSYGPMNYKEASLQAAKENNNVNPTQRRITSIATPAIESEML